MSELYFLRHGKRIDHCGNYNREEALYPDFHDYDPSLSKVALEQVRGAAEDIASSTQAFPEVDVSSRKNVFIHFSPYLRCCQTADLMVTYLKEILQAKFPSYKIRFQLLGDFALSEWIHDKMKNKPPFVDSNDAYNMYTPNLKLMKNRSACSNFRPTNTLGPYNEPNLSYKDYQNRCKNYFKKLLATYDKPSYIRNKDIIIVVSHGYAVNCFMSYFISHPIFAEIPEAKVNFAKRVLVEGIEEEDGEYEPTNYTWKLELDSLGMLKDEEIDSTLNLDTDIVYYKTNFIKRDELNNEFQKSDIPREEKPRASFKVEVSGGNDSIKRGLIRNNNPICSAAREWSPQLANKFRIQSEFKLKLMNDEAFKKKFNLKNHPSRPPTPEVSPNSEPTRSNSIIDLSKLQDNNDIYKPMRLKYSTASDIPIHRLNSKINSQVNLAQYQRSEYASSNEGSAIDLFKHLPTLQNRYRSSSNPGGLPHSISKDSYFPTATERSKNNGILSGSGSPEDMSDDLHVIEENREQPIASSFMHRTGSLNSKKKSSSRSKSRVFKLRDDDSDDSLNLSQRLFTLTPLSPKGPANTPQRANTVSAIPAKNSSESSDEKPTKFIPLFPTGTANNTNSSSNSNIYRGSGALIGNQSSKVNQGVLYGLGLDGDSSSSEDEGNNNQYIWFGQNRK